MIQCAMKSVYSISECARAPTAYSSYKYTIQSIKKNKKNIIWGFLQVPSATQKSGCHLSSGNTTMP